VRVVIAEAWGGVERFVGAVLRVEVSGVVRPQPRPRMVGQGKARRVVSTLRDSPAARWKRRVSAEVSVAMHATGWETVGRGVPVGMRMLVVFGTKTPERWGRLRTAVRRADFDNVAKLVADVLVACGVMEDDGQVAAPRMLHVWGPPERAGIVVEVGEVSGGVVDGLLAAWGVRGAVESDRRRAAPAGRSARARAAGGVGRVVGAGDAGGACGGAEGVLAGGRDSAVGRAPAWLE